MQWARKQTGFTIVELLIVVVVIAILAAITIVSYNGVKQRADASAIANTLGQLSRKVKSYAVTHAESYPASFSDAGIVEEPGYYYSANNDVAPKTFCITMTYGTQKYFVTHEVATPTPGTCEGLVAWWPLNDNPRDVAGSAGGTMIETLPTIPGQNGQASGAFDFSQSSTARIQMQSNWGSQYNFNQISGSAWINPTSISGTLGIFWSATGPIHWELMATEAWRIRLAGSDVRNFTTVFPPLNTWTHIAFTYNRTTSSFAYYVNGQTVHATTTASGGESFFQNNGSNTGEIGASLSGASRSWQGALDDVRIYNKELSAGEVAEIYAKGAQ